MSTNLEVFFCDLCNESVPETDIAGGKAIRIKGRVVGACCTTALTTTPRAPQVRVSGTSGVVATGVIVLAGVAAAAAFLDWRLSNENGALARRLVAVEEGTRSGQDSMIKLEEAVTQVGARLNFDGLAARLDTLDARVDNARNSLELRATRIGESLQAVSESGRNGITEQRDALAGIKATVQGVLAEVTALRAMPSPPPVAVSPTAEPSLATPASASASAEPDMPPELKHQVIALGDEDPGTRFASVDKLLRSRDLRVLSALLPMAKDANTFVRRLTVEGLRDFRRADSIETLLIALADPEPIVRLTAHASLRVITTQRIEFDDGTTGTRSTGQRRWQEWWDKNRSSFAF